MCEKIETLEDLRRFLKDFFKDLEVEVYLFGSRARGDFSPYSDVDIAIYSQKFVGEINPIEGNFRRKQLSYK